jgi:hypothetical protein
MVHSWSITTTATMSLYEESTVNGVAGKPSSIEMQKVLPLTIDAAETSYVTTTVTALGGDVSFAEYVSVKNTIRCDSEAALLIFTLRSRQPHDSSWSQGTTNPNVVYQATETVYASETVTQASGDGSSSELSTSTSTIAPTTTVATTSSAAANTVSVFGYAGYRMGTGFPGVVALAACFATMGVALFGRRF